MDHATIALQPLTGSLQTQTDNELSLREATAASQPPTDPPQMQTANELSLREATVAPQPLTGPAQTHSGNKPLLTHSTRVNVGVVTKRQLRRIIHRHKKDMSELKVSIQSLTLAMQMFEDRVITRILKGMKSQGDPSSHNIGEDDVDADDGQHDEATIHFHDDVLGHDGDDVVAADVTLQSDDAKGVHVPQADSVIDAFVGGEGDLHSLVAKGVHISEDDSVIDAFTGGERDLQSLVVEGQHLLESYAVVEAAEGGDGNLALVQAERDHILQSTPEASGTRLLSAESDVLHCAALILDPTEQAWSN